MKLKLIGSIFAFLSLSPNIYSQGEAAVPFLVLQQSPQFTGAAQVGVAVPPIDPMGFYLNPAVLGETSKEFNFTTLFLPSKVNWLNIGLLEFNTFGMSLGYNFKESFLQIPLSVGFGFISNKLNTPDILQASQTQYGGSFHPNLKGYDKFHSYSIGLSYEYFLSISIGLSIKSFKSDLGVQPTENEVELKVVDETALDYGALVTVPISKLFYTNFGFKVKDYWVLQPKTNISIGYSLTNIGDEIQYVDIAQKDPIPRTARLGYNINLGFDLVSDNLKFNLLDYYFITEAEDILITRDESNNYKTEYQDWLGDISFGKHVIGLKGDDKVVVRKAHIFRILETVTFSIGRFYGRGYYPLRKTSGVTISTTGLSKYLNANFDNEILQFISEHISIEYYNSTLFKDWLFETDIAGIGIFIKNINF